MIPVNIVTEIAWDNRRLWVGREFTWYLDLDDDERPIVVPITNHRKHTPFFVAHNETLTLGDTIVIQ